MGVFSDLFNFGEKVKWFKVFNSLQEAEKTIPLFKSVTLDVNNQLVCLSRLPDGFYAVQDKCPHLGASLSAGKCNALGEIVCPWHSYRFNLKRGDETTGQNLVLEIFKVELRKDGLYVGKILT